MDNAIRIAFETFVHLLRLYMYIEEHFDIEVFWTIRYHYSIKDNGSHGY